ncbi:hypothetical protein [Chondromyces apiculatus]|uniref:Uncharacterized protein n=1 Tax=Chondromyces apiculatus DSM 436 TaxID=1192034 RepID=A0A017TGF1_9BACT|nr:hypothetical protein [Chondromyces apiculatus]EYF08324.1 Hypothetical protein CAP_6085 [Chondromyces apiculatus DSM 436]
MSWRLRVLPALVLAACAAPSRPDPAEAARRAEAQRLAMAQACTPDAGERTARCPCAVMEDLAALKDGPALDRLVLLPIEPLRLDTLTRLHHLRALGIDTSRAPETSGVGKLSQLRKLAITVPAGGLAEIGQLRQLEELTLFRSRRAPPPSRLDLGPLRALTALHVLDLEELKVHDLGPLGGMAKLERLVLTCGPGVDLTALRDLVALRELTLLGHPVADLGPLASLRNLQVLTLGPHHPSSDARASEEGVQGDEGDLPVSVEVRDFRQQLARLSGVEVRRKGFEGEALCDLDPDQCPDGCEERRKRRRRPAALP